MGVTTDSFSELNIPQFLIENLTKQNITTPTNIQSKAIPHILDNRDVIGQSPTGSGKTLAYLLPILTKIKPELKVAQALILVPTRELAMQIYKIAKELGEKREIIVVSILGEANTSRQLENLKKKPHIIVATPGRILDFIKNRKVNSQTIKTIVVDEADKMWSMGFKDDVISIIKTTQRDRQVVIFSATIPEKLIQTTEEVLNSPEQLFINPRTKVPETIKHIFISTDERSKGINLQKIINYYKPNKAIVFISSNEGVYPFVKRFSDFGFSVAGLHSSLNQQERKTVLEKFRTGKAQLLVTTDLFARGMDINGVEIVFNFDLPIDDKHYIHRVGRTGRAGKDGLVVNFVTPAQKFIMNKYQKQLKISIQEYGISADNKVFPVVYKKSKE